MSKKPSASIDALAVEHNTPIPPFRVFTYKYAELFQSLKPGSCIVCNDVKENERVANTLRLKIKAGVLPHLKGCTVITRNRCEDGKARAWAKAPEPASKLAAGAPWPSAGAK